MSNNQSTRRSIIIGLATATTIGLAGCSQADSPESETPTGTPDGETPTATAEGSSESSTPTSTDSDTQTATATDNGLPDGVSYPEPGKEPTEITLLETSDDYEVVIVDADQQGKYIGNTMRVPKTEFVTETEGYFYFRAYWEEDGRSPQEGFALRPEDVEQTAADFRENGRETDYEIEGPLYAVESVGGGNVLVLGGDTVTVTEM